MSKFKGQVKVMRLTRRRAHVIQSQHALQSGARQYELERAMNIQMRNIIWTAAAALLMGGLAASAIAQDFATEGLVVMYTFDNDMVDGDKLIDAATDDGESQDGIIHGDPESIEGVIGEAFKFDGSPNVYVEIPAMGDWEAVSVEVWAREDAFAGIQGIVSTWQWVPGKVHFKFQENQIQVDKNGVGKIRYNAEAETWYHIVYTTDAPGNVLILYVNGNEEARDEDGDGALENMNERRIASEHDGRFLNGAIDEMRIYNRVLEADEVMTNFEAKSNRLSVDPRGKMASAWAELKR